jgi:hypothetical protein
MARPVGRVCPDCDSPEYTSCKSEATVAFLNDRKCKKCGIKYRVATPTWAAIVFMAVGVPMIFGGVWAVTVQVAADPPNPIGMVVFGMLTAMGLLSAWHGMRALRWPGKV